MGITERPSINSVYDDIQSLIAVASPKDGLYLKTMYCYLDVGSWYEQRKPDVIHILYTAQSYFPDERVKRAKLRSSSIQRISSSSLPPRIKCGSNYINSRLATIDVNIGKKKPHSLPLLYDSRGFVTESSGACIFSIHGNKIYTPPVSQDILHSITRQFILEEILPSRTELTVCIRNLTRWDLYAADSLFLVGTHAEITVIDSLDDYVYSNHPELDRIIKSFFAATSR